MTQPYIQANQAQSALWNSRGGEVWVEQQELLDRLSLIALGRSAGFSLDEIGEMLGLDGPLQIDRARLSEKADELDQTIRRLTALRNALRHAAECPAPSHMECPTFNRLRQAAVSRGREPRRLAKGAPSPRSGS